MKDEELLLKSSEDKLPTSWSRDGRFLLYTTSDPKTRKSGLWVLPLEGDKKPFPFLRTEFNNGSGQFSPVGRWVAYVSDESGRNEIYVRTFSPDSTAAASDTGGKWLISTNGGSGPRWRREYVGQVPPGLRIMVIGSIQQETQPAANSPRNRGEKF